MNIVANETQLIMRPTNWQSNERITVVSLLLMKEKRTQSPRVLVYIIDSVLTIDYA